MHATAEPAPTAPPATTQANESERLPVSWRRYFVDQKRFSALFPAPPKAIETGRNGTYEAHDPAGALFSIVCGPAAEDHDQMKRARASAATSGSIISDGYAYFFETNGYLAHIRLPDGSERVILFVEYSGRYCTATAEVRSSDETSMRFIESFRPEPVTR